MLISQIAQIKWIYFLKDKFPKPTQEEIENLSTSMFSKEIKFLDGFTGNSSKCLKRNRVNPVLSENKREHFPAYGPYRKRKLKTNIPHEHKYKNPLKILAN